MKFYEGMDEERGGGETPAAAPQSKEVAKSDTALLPKSLLGSDAKPGDTITLSVVHVYEDEIEVTKSKQEEPQERPAPSGFAEEIDQLATQE